MQKFKKTRLQKVKQKESFKETTKHCRTLKNVVQKIVKKFMRLDKLSNKCTTTKKSYIEREEEAL